jgi:MoxR-like ATPase
VVLIDEIDKAPRDVPNDLLAEIDELKFNIPEIATHKQANEGEIEKNETKEQGHEFSTQASLEGGDLRPLIIITSNSERALPDPFLRRCLYYHLPFPSFDEKKGEEEATVQSIVASRLGYRFKDNQPFVSTAIGFFKFLREQNLERQPGLAELLNWLNYLVPKSENLTSASLADLPQQDVLDGVKVALLKNSSDQGEAEGLYQNWLDSLVRN